MKHTQIKWTVHNQEIIINGLSQITCFANNKMGITTEEAQANAERIVFCVNGYDALEKENKELFKESGIDKRALELLGQEASKLREALEHTWLFASECYTRLDTIKPQNMLNEYEKDFYNRKNQILSTASKALKP